MRVSSLPLVENWMARRCGPSTVPRMPWSGVNNSDWSAESLPNRNRDDKSRTVIEVNRIPRRKARHLDCRAVPQGVRCMSRWLILSTICQGHLWRAVAGAHQGSRREVCLLRSWDEHQGSVRVEHPAIRPRIHLHHLIQEKRQGRRCAASRRRFARSERTAFVAAQFAPANWKGSREDRTEHPEDFGTLCHREVRA